MMNGHFLSFEMYTHYNGRSANGKKGYNKYSGCASRRLFPFIKFRVNEQTLATMRNG
jgi:hypothetical protein